MTGRTTISTSNRTLRSISIRKLAIAPMNRHRASKNAVPGDARNASAAIGCANVAKSALSVDWSRSHVATASPALSSIGISAM